MSTTTIDLDELHTADAAPGKGVFDRLIDNRLRQGRATVRPYLARLPASSLADLGFKPEHIAAIRATGDIPADFWR